MDQIASLSNTFSDEKMRQRSKPTDWIENVGNRRQYLLVLVAAGCFIFLLKATFSHCWRAHLLVLYLFRKILSLLQNVQNALYSRKPHKVHAESLFWRDGPTASMEGASEKFVLRVLRLMQKTLSWQELWECSSHKWLAPREWASIYDGSRFATGSAARTK